MKNLGKLSINPEKVIKNEELVNLRGGGYETVWEPGRYKCCWDDYPNVCSSCTQVTSVPAVLDCSELSHVVQC